MAINVEKLANTVEAILTVAFLVLSLTISFALGEHSSAGKYILLAVLLLMIIVHILSNGFVLDIKFTKLYTYMIIFILVCLLGSLFATNSIVALNRTLDITEMLIMIVVFYICLRNKEIDYLFKILMWTGYIVVFYAIIYYGLDYFLLVLKSSGRVVNTALNANTLGLCGAYSIVITAYFILYNGFKIWNLIAIPTMAVIAASGSRKALVVMVVGVVMIFILKNYEDKNVINAFLKSIVTLIALVLTGIAILQLPMFATTLERMQTLLFALKGSSGADSSALVRLQMVEIGKELFEKSPIVGVGINNPQLYTASYFGICNYYLHNNYIEILAGAGIVGFIAYYWIYVELLIGFVKNRNFRDGAYNITVLMMAIRLIMDIGAVTYETKLTYFYLLIFYIEYERTACQNKSSKG
ncbi:MAG: O-antigen ligase family protein [Oribacterium sp.]|nr:O-antigen ligase family protein [Oribacterium sp.]